MAEKRPIELEEGWLEMQTGINKLIRLLEGEEEEQFTAEQYMTSYTTVYNMCTQKPPYDYSEQLYQRYKQAFENYIRERVLPSLRDHSNETLLKQLYTRWGNHKLMVRWLSRFFNYLDRYYVLRHSLPNLKDVGLTCFRDNVYQEIKKKGKDAVLKLIEREREGELIDRALVKNILGIFIEVGMGQMECYERDFEEHLLSDTADYYRRNAAQWIMQDSCPAYMIKAEECLGKEEERVDGFLHASTKSKLLREVENEVLSKHQQELLQKEHSGCAVLLRDDKTEDLSRMYRLFHRIPNGLNPVADTFRKHVEDEGNKLVNETAEAIEAKKDKDKESGKVARESSTVEQTFVRAIIELHDKYLAYVTSCFNNSSLFHKALKEAFEAFCNKNVGGSTTAELMANFCDTILRKGGAEKLSDEAIDETLDKVVKLLAYVSDKDLFSEFYRKKLARRLLHNMSANDDHERSILTRLKQQCGAQFTSKMEGMVTDLQLGREKQQAFDEWLNTKEKKLPLDLSVTVLTTGFWPTYKAVDLALPSEMVQGVETFKEFYEGDTKHRKLTWYHALGSCSVKGFFDKKPIEMQMSPLQATILMLFNDSAELAYKEIQERVNMPDEDLVRCLASLTLGKYKVLAKSSPEVKRVTKEDKFSFNSKFTDKMARIKVPLPPVDEKKKVIEDVDKDRRYAIDAAIVRTMKSRKQLEHQKLVLEVVQQLQRMFKPDFKLIKKRIEDLISREYLERDKDNPTLFRYLA